MNNKLWISIGLSVISIATAIGAQVFITKGTAEGVGNK